ncbi:hypothetical protein [Methylosinus sp. PW1]|uniref:hypothetical protein n=1 Tax=Methylosinus sp. PW1 TaxID=107636 RepID=UPI00056B9F30|nr:hypothetical protein [Methylosinus sp. PW1]
MADSLKLRAGAAFFVSPQALAAIAYTPENIHLGDYVFLPFVRNGLAAAIAKSPPGNRATITIDVEVADSNDGSASEKVGHELTLIGPGDLTGVDVDQIIRREPAPNTFEAEEGYLAHIEFARPDYPWLFSPTPAQGDVCQPWLALIVCEAAVSRIEPSADERPDQIWTKKGQLQPLTDHTRFCHAQLVGVALDGEHPRMRGSGADTVETRLSDEHAPANLSRILCPRRLAQGVDYIAALVPAFDCGVKAGLGQSGGTLAPAWTRSPGDEAADIVLPVYDSWAFRTKPGGDFRALAERIKGIAAPWAIGRRFIDLSGSIGDLPAMVGGEAGGVQVLECALYSPAANGPAAPAPWPVERRDALRKRLDEANADDPDLPRVGARLYARYQRAANRLGAAFGSPPFGPFAAATADADWFTQINTNPLHRIVAGLGARVVQKDQEQLMQAAWAQVDGIRRANQVVIWAKFAEVLNLSIMKRHLQPLDPGRLMQVTRNVHARIRDAGAPRTVAAAVIDSRTAQSTLDAGFRRATRPSGPLARRQDLGTSPSRMVATEGGFRDHRRLYGNPDGISGLSEAGRKFFSPEVIAKVSGAPLDRAQAVLAEKAQKLAQAGAAVTVLGRSPWVGPVEPPGDIFGRQALEEIEARIPQSAAGGFAEAGAAAEVMVGIANAESGVSDAAKVGLAKVERVAPQQDWLRAVRPTTPVRRFGGIELTSPGLSPSVTAPTPRPTIRVVPQLAEPSVAIGRRASPIIVDRPQAPPAGAPPREAPLVRFETDVSRRVTDVIKELNAQGMDKVRADMAGIVAGVALPPPARTDLGPLAVTKPSLLKQIDPLQTARAAFKGRLVRLPDCVAPDWFDRVGLAPIMAAPVFNRPMYAALEDYDREWIAPGLGLIPERDFITLLSINPAFAEAFLIGASDEMGRELLWRDYPTDQRGTYFKRFWDPDEDELTNPIHRFDKKPLGSHFSIGGDKAAGAGALALVARAELFRRFPDTVVTAMRASNASGPPQFIAGSEAAILFHIHLDPDYRLVGFDLTAEQVTGGGNWWIVIAQNPAAPRFGLATNPSPSTDHDNLDWADFGAIPPGRFLSTSRSFPVRDPNSHPQTVQWPGHAGVVARVLLTNPVRAAFRADRLISSIRTQR